MSSEMALPLEVQSPVISIRNLGKKYHIYKKPHHRLLQGIAGGRKLHREFWALWDVDLEVYPGETVGIIGRNGAGKSTLLQLICGTLQPSTGEVLVRGRIAALLELGAGFNPEFTGRENVYLKGSLLGMTRAQIEQRFEEILAFSEIGEYIDQPVKTYSSGMFVRLAFAVSVSSQPDILIVDEALAVGDVYFQRKCHQRIRELQEQGCTLLFVTHSVDALARLCERGVVLDKGAKIYDGAVRGAVSEYMRLVFGAHDNPAKAQPKSAPAGIAAGGRKELLLARIKSGGGEDVLSTRPGYNRNEIRMGNGHAIVGDFAVLGQPTGAPVVHVGEAVEILVRYHFRERAERLMYGFQIRSINNIVVYSTNTFYQTGQLQEQDADETVIGTISFPCRLQPGQYYVTLGVSQFDERREEIVALDRRMDAFVLTVLGDRHRAQGIVELDLKLLVGTAR